MSDLPCGFGTCDRSRLETRIRELEAGSDVCGDEALHCETSRRLREESRDYSRAMMEEERLRKAAEARADKAEAERDKYRDAVKLALTHIRAMTPSTQHPAMARAVQALKTALKEATDGQ